MKKEIVNVFVTPGLLAHIRISIMDGIQPRNFRTEDNALNKFIQRHYTSAPIKLWGVKESIKGIWEKVKPDDWILFYHSGNFPYCGKVLFLYPFQTTTEQLREAARLAEDVWGKDPRDGKTWPYLLFLVDVREVNIPLKKFNELTGFHFEPRPGKAVMRFMKVRRNRAEKLLDFLNNLYKTPLPRVPIKLPPLDLHERTIQKIYELGEVIGYKPEKKWRREGYEYDVVWHKPPREGPKCAFEVHVKGNLAKSLLSLKHAYDRWGSRLFLISTQNQLEEAKSKYLKGALHELTESGALSLVKFDEIEEFHQFKGRFEWLERRFGLRPR
jgi:predicted RNA-binding protein